MNKALLISGLLSVTAFCSQAQIVTPDTMAVDPQLTKTIKVVTEYEPSISDAFKINQLPNAQDTVTVPSHFTYSILSKPIATKYEALPIKAAQMKGEPLTKLYKGLVTAGLGSAYSTLLGLELSNLRSKSFEIGVSARHFASHPSATLDGNSVPMNYSANGIKVFGKKFIAKNVLYGSVGFQRDAYLRYGYFADIARNHDSDPNNDTALNKDDIAQRFMMLDAQFGVRSNKLDSAAIQYDVAGAYQFTNSIKSITEHTMSIGGTGNKRFGNKLGGVDASFEYSGLQGAYNDSLTKSVLRITPWVDFVMDQFKFTAGISTNTLISKGKFYPYPRLAASYNVVDNILIPFVEYTGRLEMNTYRSISLQNPYINDSLSVAPTNYRNVVTAGLRGSLSKNAPFGIWLTFSDVKDMYLYVNDAANTRMMQNAFVVTYDDVTIVNVHAEAGLLKVEKYKLLFRGDYFKYNTKNEKYAWHKPGWQLGILSSYNMQNKIITNFDLNVSGNQYAKSFDGKAEYYTMKPFVSANLAIEYRYTKVLSAFLKFNNISFSTNPQWNFFPAQRFHVLLGVSYAL